MKALKLKVSVTVTTDQDDKFIHGRVEFYSSPPEGYIKDLLDIGHSVPLVNCNRKGDGCPTMITELQSHNHDVPMFNNAEEFKGYLERIITDVTAAAGKVGWSVKQAEQNEQGKLTTVMQEGLKGLQLEKMAKGVWKYCKPCDTEKLFRDNECTSCGHSHWTKEAEEEQDNE